MNSAVSDSTPQCGETNEPVELARYAIAAGERVIYGQRIRGVVRLVDVPAEGRGRRFVIERELISMGELEAIVADYLDQAERWDAIPAAGPCGLAHQIIEARVVPRAGTPRVRPDDEHPI